MAGDDAAWVALVKQAADDRPAAAAAPDDSAAWNSLVKVAAGTPDTASTALPGRAPVNLRPRSESLSDEDLGIGTGPQLGPKQGAAPVGYYPGQPEFRKKLEAGQVPGAPPREHQPTELESDWLTQAIAARLMGGGLGQLAEPLLGQLGPIVGQGARGALEGAAESKMQGGSAAAGAVLGAIPGLAKGTIETAPARVRARAIRDVVEGPEEAARVPARMARKLADRAGPEGERIAEVFDADPELEAKLSKVAYSHPKEAAAALTRSIDRLDQVNDAAYAAIDKGTGGVQLLDMVARLDKLRRSYLENGSQAAAEAADRVRASLIKNYGFEGKVPEATMLKSGQVRTMATEAGGLAFAGDPTVPKSLRARVQTDLWKAYNGAIEDAAKRTPGVDAAALAERNGRIATMIPMRNVLNARETIKATGSRSIGERIKQGVERGVEGVGVVGGLVHGGGLTPRGLAEAAIGYAAPKAAAAAGKGATALGRAADIGLANLAKRGGVAIPEVGGVAAARVAPKSYEDLGLPPLFGHPVEAGGDPNADRKAVAEQVFQP